MEKQKSFMHRSAFRVHRFLGLPLNSFSVDNLPKPRAGNSMATQIQTHTTPATPREIISYDPATGAEVGRVPITSAEDVTRAVARARAAQAGWSALSYRARGRVVLRAREIVLAELDEIAALI